MWIVKNRKIFYIFSGIMIALSIVAVSIWGLKGSIDFKGGSLLEITYNLKNVSADDGFKLPTAQEITDKLETLKLGEISVRTSGESGYIIRTLTLSDTDKNAVLAKLVIENKGKTFNPEEKKFASVGPLLGKEALYKSFWSIVFVLGGSVRHLVRNFERPAPGDGGNYANAVFAWRHRHACGPCNTGSTTKTSRADHPHVSSPSVAIPLSSDSRSHQNSSAFCLACPFLRILPPQTNLWGILEEY
jgi:hypothetical protein